MSNGLLDLSAAPNPSNVFSPAMEVAAYECLWLKFHTEAKLARIFEKHGHERPYFVAQREGVSSNDLRLAFQKLTATMPFDQFSALFHRDFDYPQPLRDARNPLEILYYSGNIDLLSSKSVAVVGARKATEDGKRRANRIARILVRHGITVMSGLAAGIDAAAHAGAIEAKGETIAVIGTPLNESYPKENAQLQKLISSQFLLVSHVPFLYYGQHDWVINRRYFPERNKIMSALSRATIIVEASESSGSLIQAKAALEQGRKLLILKSCFERGLPWPKKFQQLGAIRIDTEDDLLRAIKDL